MALQPDCVYPKLGENCVAHPWCPPLFRYCGESLRILGKAVRDTSVDTCKALTQLISPKHHLFKLNRFQMRMKLNLPKQQEEEMQNVAAHLEDCQNMDVSQSTLINNLS